MTFRHINTEAMQGMQHFHVPAVGGIDSMNPKTLVPPGTLMSCLNYEVALEAGYQPSGGIAEFVGSTLSVPENFLKVLATDSNSDFKFEDIITGSLYQLGERLAGADKFTTIGKIQIVAVDPDVNPLAQLGEVYFTIEEGDPASIENMFSESGGTTYGFGPAPDTQLEGLIPTGVSFIPQETIAGVSATFEMSGDGLHLYLMDDDIIYQYDMESPGKLSSIKSTGKSFDTDPSSNPDLFVSSKLLMKPDGTKYFLYDRAGASVLEYSMTTPHDIGTSVYSGNSIDVVSLLGFVPSDQNMTANPDGTLLFALDPSTNVVETLTLSVGWDLSSTVSTGNVSGALADAGTRISHLSNDGNFLFFLEDDVGATSGRSFIGYEFGTPFDVTTLQQFVTSSITLSSSVIINSFSMTNDLSRMITLSPSSPMTLTEYKFSPSVLPVDNVIVIDNEFGVKEITSSHTNYQTDYAEMASQLIGKDIEPLGTGAITGLFFFNGDVYASRTSSILGISRLSRLTMPEDQSVTPSWKLIDLGYEVGYKDGRIFPITIYEREFIEDNITLQDPVEANPSAGRSVITDNSTAFASWDAIANAFADSGSDEDSAVSRVQMPGGGIWAYSQRLDLTGFPFKDLVKGAVEVEGVEVTVRHKFDAEGNLASGTESGQWVEAKLLNVGSTANRADTTTRGSASMGTWFETTVGGATDKWNASLFSSERLLSDDFGVSLQFRMEGDTAFGSTAPTAIMSVAWVKIKVYFTNGDERIYFWNGSTDVASGDLVNTSTLDGSFTSGNAAGFLTLYNGTTLENIVPNLEIRSQSGGGGDLLATTSDKAVENGLPTVDQMKINKSLMLTKVLNFTLDSAKNAVYGVTGAGPAFHYNGRHFWNVRTPVPPHLDRPRYIANHQNHLALAFDSGSVILSPPGRPSVFSGVQGAVEFGFADRITGLSSLSGNALGVFGETSLNAIIGTSVNNFTTQSISKSSGARDYTVTDAGQPVYLDSRGISTVQATQTFGDFSWGRLSQAIAKELNTKTQDSLDVRSSAATPVVGLAFKSKNQYRLYFSDGSILTMTLFGADGSSPMFTEQNYSAGNSFPADKFVPTAFAQTVDVKGREITLIGTTEGKIIILDTGNPGIILNSGMSSYDCRLTFNPFFADAPFLNIKYNEVMVHLRSSGNTNLKALAGVNFLEPAASETEEDLIVGTASVPVELSLPFNRGSAHLPNVTDGFVFGLKYTADHNPAHLIQALTYKGIGLSDTNSSPKQY